MTEKINIISLSKELNCSILDDELNNILCDELINNSIGRLTEELYYKLRTDLWDNMITELLNLDNELEIILK